MSELETLKKAVDTVAEKIVNLKKTQPVDKEAIGSAVKELLEAKKAYADKNGGIGVDGKKFELPLSKAEKKAKEKAEKAAKAAAEGGGGGKQIAAANSKKDLKKLAKKAEKEAKKAAAKAAAADGTPPPSQDAKPSTNIKTPVAKPSTATTTTNVKKPNNTKGKARPPPPQTKLSPYTLAFSPNSPSLTSRPIIALTVACLTDTIDDLTIVSDHSRTESGPVLCLPNHRELSGDVAIARYLARRKNPSSVGGRYGEDLLGGGNEEDEATIDSWVDYAIGMMCLPLPARIPSIEATLRSVLPVRSYLHSDTLTLADIAVFASLGFPMDSTAVSSIKSSLSSRDVKRWIDMVRGHPALRTATQLAMDVHGKGSQVVFDEAAPLLEPLTAGMAPLQGAIPGSVVTRFPPEPSGYLHVGHAKAVLMNQYYARHYNGRLIVRFDDTNPSKEKEEFREAILSDLEMMGVEPDVVTYTSDYFGAIRGYALELIQRGLAYMDDTQQEKMQEERMAKINSKHRGQSVEDALKYFEAMTSKKGSIATGGDGEEKDAVEEVSNWCLRAKIDMQSLNGTLRDPVLYRRNTVPHHRTGSTYYAYPTYDLACPVVDSLEGVTHALRTTEYDDRNVQYQWIQSTLGLRRVRIQPFARMNFRHTVLSKRHLGWFVDEGKVDGWSDARFPTVRGVLRRGLTMEALRLFILGQGASKRIVTMEWGKFWAENKKEIDRIAKRFMAIGTDDNVELVVENGPKEDGPMEFLSADLLPKDASFGKRLVRKANKVLLEKGDVEGIEVGEEIVLMRWGVVKITKVDGGLSGIHLPDGNFKTAKRKLTWLASVPEITSFHVTLTEFDNLISKEKLDDGDDFKDFINPNTVATSTVIGDVGLKGLQKDEIIQLERRGYYRVDQPYINEKRGLILYMIPDGKAKAMSGISGKLAHR